MLRSINIVCLGQEIKAATAQGLRVLTQYGSAPLVYHETSYVDHQEHYLRKEIEKQQSVFACSNEKYIFVQLLF